MSALPDYASRTAGTPYADRLCARTGPGYGIGSHRIQCDGPSEAQIIAGGLAKVAAWIGGAVIAALLIGSILHHGVADHTPYAHQQIAER